MKLVILDRDGVINADSAEYVKSAQEFVPLPGSLEAIGKLCEAGWTVTIASNQSGVGRGLFSSRLIVDPREQKSCPTILKLLAAELNNFED